MVLFKIISLLGGFHKIMNYLDFLLYGLSKAIILEKGFPKGSIKFICKELDGKHSRIIVIYDGVPIESLGW